MNSKMALAAREIADPFGPETEFCGQEVVLARQGCLYWPIEKTLIVSDLHLEKGSSIASRTRLFLPPYDSTETLKRLMECVQLYLPKTIISLGDSFHDDEGGQRLASHCVEQLRQLMEGRQWIWITGNHDPNPPEWIGGEVHHHIAARSLYFCHEPAFKRRSGEVAGHLHPSAKIRQRGKSVRRRCFAEDGSRMILPAFGAYTGGLNVLDPAFDGILNRQMLTAWMIGTETVYRIDGKKLVD